MNTTSNTILTAALVAAGLSVAGLAAAQAASGQDNNAAEIQTFLSAKTGLMDAVKAAEAETGGKAMDASFEMLKDGSGAFEVELVKADGSQVMATVDTKDGATTSRAMPADDVDDHADGEADDD